MAGSKKRTVEGDGKVESSGVGSSAVEPSVEREPKAKKSKSSHLYDASIEALDGSNLSFEVDVSIYMLHPFILNLLDRH